MVTPYVDQCDLAMDNVQGILEISSYQAYALCQPVKVTQHGNTAYHGITYDYLGNIWFLDCSYRSITPKMAANMLTRIAVAGDMLGDAYLAYDLVYRMWCEEIIAELGSEAPRLTQLK